MKTLSRFLKKLKTELPYISAISLLGIYPKKTLTRIDTCTPIFIVALFAIAKIWRQPKCISMDEWIKKMRYISLSCKKEGNLAIYDNMDGP